MPKHLIKMQHCITQQIRWWVMCCRVWMQQRLTNFCVDYSILGTWFLWNCEVKHSAISCNLSGIHVVEQALSYVSSNILPTPPRLPRCQRFKGQPCSHSHGPINLWSPLFKPNAAGVRGGRPWVERWWARAGMGFPANQKISKIWCTSVCIYIYIYI